MLQGTQDACIESRAGVAPPSLPSAATFVHPAVAVVGTPVLTKTDILQFVMQVAIGAGVAT